MITGLAFTIKDNVRCHLTYKQMVIGYNLIGDGMKQLESGNTIYDVIRRNIKRYRKEQGLTSAALAEKVDLSHDFIRQIESEKVRYNFSVDTFYRISRALGVGMDKLAEIDEHNQE